jgi:predicted house-cleaning NTP pyrophosphatase (Maf/HAM1 superfamily)
LEFEVVVSGFPETLDKSLFTPAEYVAENARQKATAVWNELPDVRAKTNGG